MRFDNGLISRAMRMIGIIYAAVNNSTKHTVSAACGSFNTILY